MEPYDFFAKVRKCSTSIVLIPLDEVMTPASYDILKNNWRTIIGTDLPKHWAYVIYDKKTKFTFTGLILIFLCYDYSVF